MTRRVRRRRSQSQRCAFSLGIIVLLLAAILLSSALSERYRNLEDGASLVHAAISDQDVLSGDVFAKLDNARRREVPPTFKKEVLDVPSGDDTYVNDDGSVIGFSRTESAQQTFMSIKDALESKGWVFVESGSRFAGSFVKAAGRYRWAFVSCTQISGQTSVVIQTVPLSEGAEQFAKEEV